MALAASASITDYVAFALAEHVDTMALVVAKKAAELRQVGGFVNDARAAQIESAFVDMLDGFEATALYWSAKGTEILRHHERESRVRPDTLGHGGARLGDHLFANPIPQLPGTVGIANESELDGHVPWWPTNEFGSSTQKDQGRILFGVFFQPGPETRPDSELVQEHALFDPRARGEYRGSGRVVHEIQPKHFIQHAAVEIEAGWRADIEGLMGRFLSEIP